MENRPRLRLWPLFCLATVGGLKFAAELRLAFKILPASTGAPSTQSRASPACHGVGIPGEDSYLTRREETAQLRTMLSNMLHSFVHLFWSAV